MTTIAIAYPEYPKRVQLWCTVEKKYEDGSFDFEVINGLWDGTFYTNNTIRVEASGEIFPAIIVWEGNVHGRYRDYNSAIAWIERKISED
jgi:hypothetical protein